MTEGQEGTQQGGAQEGGQGGGEGAKPVTFDAAAMEKMVTDAIAKGLAAQKAQGDEGAEGGEKEKPAQTPDAVADWLKPHIEPHLKEIKDVRVQTAMAQDAVTFYTDKSNEDAFEHRGRIEEVVANEARRGNYITRKDAFNWLRGGELHDTIMKQREVTWQSKVKAASEAETAGPSLGSVKLNKPFESMNTEEMEQALKGVSF